MKKRKTAKRIFTNFYEYYLSTNFTNLNRHEFH